MGLTRQYLQWEQAGVFNAICSSSGNVAVLGTQYEGGLVASPAAEHVIIWRLRDKSKHAVLEGEVGNYVTRICPSTDKKHLAVGAFKGSIFIYEYKTCEKVVTFNGHKSEVTVLNYNSSGTLLVSGSKDTAVVVWDIVAECGLYRLKGHKGPITQARFLNNHNFLVSRHCGKFSSQDSFIKFWDLSIQHCFFTHVEHKNEVWDFVILRNESLLVTGSIDSELRAWEIQYLELDSFERRTSLDMVSLVKRGSVIRKGLKRVMSMDSINDCIFVCHGSDKFAEAFEVLSDEALAKRAKRQQKKKRHNSEDSTQPTESFANMVKTLPLLKTDSKVSSLMLQHYEKIPSVVCGLSNNAIQRLPLDLASSANSNEDSLILSLPGHRFDVRTVSISADNTLLASGSKEALKLWNSKSLTCIRTIATGYVISSLFVPGDRHMVVGLKEGSLLLIDIASGTILETVSAHLSEVWSLSPLPSQSGFLSGSSDKTVKEWLYDLVEDEHGQKRLSVSLSRTLELEEDILSIKVTVSGKYLAVALLDNTVKVFFLDTFKDSQLMVTGSADRNIKLWGMDFGDCHKSMFAHDDAVTCVQFLPQTHLIFTAGKDGLIKQWDGDKFLLIQVLKVSASHDRTMRLWERTMEPLVLEDVNENQLNKEIEESIAKEEDQPLIGASTDEVDFAGRKSHETICFAEKLIEALEIHHTFTLSEEYVLNSLKRIKARVHHHRIISTKSLLPIVERLRTTGQRQIRRYRDSIGFNLSAIRFIQQQIEEKNQVTWFDDATEKLSERRKRSKFTKRSQHVITVVGR